MLPDLAVQNVVHESFKAWPVHNVAILYDISDFPGLSSLATWC